MNRPLGRTLSKFTAKFSCQASLYAHHWPGTTLLAQGIGDFPFISESHGVLCVANK